MPSEQMRSLLLRVLLDDDFHNLILTDCHKAMEGYKLTDDEKNALMHPSSSIHELLQPKSSISESWNNTTLTCCACATTTTTTTTTTAYCVTTTTYCVTTTSHCVTEADSTVPLVLANRINSDAVEPLVNSIHQSSGTERFDRILQLISQLTV